jgi:tetratricopeptide (TPR) repeat protein
MSWYLLGISYIMRGLETGILSDLPDVIQPLLRSAAINPSFHPAWMMAGAMYALRGDYAYAVKVIDKAVAVEKAGTGFIFLGSFVQRASLHIHLNELEAGETLLDRAINAYPTLDHVYADTMTAHAYFMRGILEEHRGNHAAAQSHFIASCALADSRDHRLAIGAAWTKSKLGLSRTAFRRGDKAASDSALSEALRMHVERLRFVWGFIMGAADADTWYEAAATHAVRGEMDKSLAALRKAVDLGWADMNQFKHDLNFAEFREREEYRVLVTEAKTRVTLSPPVGSGGLPSFEAE